MTFSLSRWVAMPPCSPMLSLLPPPPARQVIEEWVSRHTTDEARNFPATPPTFPAPPGCAECRCAAPRSCRAIPARLPLTSGPPLPAAPQVMAAMNEARVPAGPILSTGEWPACGAHVWCCTGLGPSPSLRAALVAHLAHPGCPLSRTCAPAGDIVNEPQYQQRGMLQRAAPPSGARGLGAGWAGPPPGEI